MLGALKGSLYDRLTRSFERGPGRQVRGRLLARARGAVLEIGAGTGANLAYYPPSLDRLVLTEPDRALATRLVRKLERSGRRGELVHARADALPFPDGSFDTVVATLVLCTVPDQRAALTEIRRVLRPDGAFVFLEHVRSADERRARWQDRLERPWGVVAGGCHPNRRTLEAIEAAGFTVQALESGEMPGFPRLVRPYVAGCAPAPATASGEGPPTERETGR